MRSCEVLIVGGGPAGSTCAWQLRRADVDAVVWDRRTFPRDKLCAGWITPQVVAALELDFSAYAGGGRTVQPIRGFCVGRMGDAAVRIEYDRPVSYGIRRCEFDHYLLQRCGAELRLGQPVRSLRRADGRWILNEAVAAKVVVGAGGHFCPVAQRLGAQPGHREPIVAAQEVELALTPAQQRAAAVDPLLPEIYFTRDLRGYGWVFRKGAYLNIGLGRQDNRVLGKHVDEFVGFLKQRGKMPADISSRFPGHAYLLYDQAPRPLVGEAAVLCGDAAGLAYPKSGEGIRPAVESGLLAAQTLIAAGGCYDREHLDVYAQRVATRFGPRRPGWGITDVLPEWLLGILAGRFFANRWLARHVVMDRWFFHRGDPPLLPEGASGPRRRDVEADARMA